ncbi:MAG: hypothetical protein AB8B84_04190 [Granulosicoccus sp.]
MQKTPQTEGQSQPDQRQIIDALNAVLESDKFTAAPQMSAFLKYVVEQAASGNMTRIKAYTVAIDALGKPDSFDPQNDPVVRVLAGRLRAALASYYESNPDTELRITMRPGSYVPSFVHRSSLNLTDRQQSSPSTNRESDSANGALNATKPQLKQQATTSRSKVINDPKPAQSTTNATQAISHSTSDSQPQALENQPEDDKRDYGANVRWMFKLPAVGIALAALGFFVGVQLTGYQSQTNGAPATAAAKASFTPAPSTMRNRPEQVSLFVSALERGNSLNSQLNTMMSGIFSESQSVRVYRILETATVQQHWPEDYLVSVNVLPLPEETRVSVQLVEAQTGRISHSENLSLSKTAIDGLSAVELDTITEFARDLVSEQGPLFEDYNSKQVADSAQ